MVDPMGESAISAFIILCGWRIASAFLTAACRRAGPIPIERHSLRFKRAGKDRRCSGAIGAMAPVAALPRDLVGADAMFQRPYVRGENFTTAIDGFVISPNVRAESVRTRDLDFQFSDHPPVDAGFVAVR